MPKVPCSEKESSVEGIGMGFSAFTQNGTSLVSQRSTRGEGTCAWVERKKERISHLDGLDSQYKYMKLEHDTTSGPEKISYQISILFIRMYHRRNPDRVFTCLCFCLIINRNRRGWPQKETNDNNKWVRSLSQSESWSTTYYLVYHREAEVNEPSEMRQGPRGAEPVLSMSSPRS